MWSVLAPKWVAVMSGLGPGLVAVMWDLAQW
jgi:hypothetical protein